LAEQTDDAIEAIGIDRARQAIHLADIVLWLGAPSDSPRADALRLATQMDRPGWAMPSGSELSVSAHTGENMDRLVATLIDRARLLLPAEGEVALHRRQREGVADMRDALRACEGEGDLLVVAEHLRTARLAMDRLSGRAGVEDMLDALFGRFCIGK
jgi:tRNA modification GTPase